MVCLWAQRDGRVRSWLEVSRYLFTLPSVWLSLPPPPPPAATASVETKRHLRLSYDTRILSTRTIDLMPPSTFISQHDQLANRKRKRSGMCNYSRAPTVRQATFDEPQLMVDSILCTLKPVQIAIEAACFSSEPVFARKDHFAFQSGAHSHEEATRGLKSTHDRGLISLFMPLENICAQIGEIKRCIFNWAARIRSPCPVGSTCKLRLTS